MAGTKEQWSIIAQTLRQTTALTWDGCHKIYLVLDEQMREKMIGWGYGMVEVGDDTDGALETLQRWYDDSCGLRFIESVRTVEGDPNDGFVALVPQGQDWPA